MSLRRLSRVKVAEGTLTPVGAMDSRISLLALGDRAGDGSSEDPAVFASSWAAVSTLSGRALEKAQQIDQEVSHLVAMPYISGVTGAMQVSFEGRIFDIQYVEDVEERKTELRLYCVERGQNA